MAVCEIPLGAESKKTANSNGDCGSGPNNSNSNGDCGSGPNNSNSNGDCENGPNASEEAELTGEFSGITEASAGGRKAKWRKKPVFVVLIFSVILIVSNVSTAVISVSLTKSLPGPCLTTTTLSCPSEWIWYEGRCYYFSEAEGTWHFSQRNCSAFGASLVAIEDQKEMKFLMRHKDRTDYWIGLKRKEGQPWEWTNGSVFNDWFEIRTDGPCAYLDDDSVSSTWCHTERNWICSKSVQKNCSSLA